MTPRTLLLLILLPPVLGLVAAIIVIRLRPGWARFPVPQRKHTILKMFLLGLQTVIIVGLWKDLFGGRSRHVKGGH